MQFSSRNDLIVTVAILIALIGTRIIGFYIIPVYDDAFITYRYSQNLADGLGFVYNKGEPVLGTTTPLFGLILAPLVWLGCSLPVVVPILNLFFDSLLVLMIIFFCSKHLNPLASIIFGLAFAVDPHTVRISVGGMEMSLFLLVSFLAVWLFDKKKNIPAIILASSSFFLRPEGIMLTSLLIFLAFWQSRKKEGLIMMAIAILLIGIPEIFIWSYYASPVSQSVSSKVAHVGNSFFMVLKRQLAPNIFHLFILPFTIWGAVVSIKKRELPSLFCLWGALYMLAYLAARPFIWSWYVFPIYFVKFLLAGIGASELIERVQFFRRISNITWAWTGSLLVLFLYAFVFFRIGTSPVITNVYDQMERYLKANSDEKSTILAEDIGAVGFFSKSYIYDDVGLITPAALKIYSFKERLSAWQPDYLMLNISLGNIKTLRASEFKEFYQPIARFSITNAQELNPTDSMLPHNWVQDYIFYKKIKKN